MPTKINSCTGRGCWEKPWPNVFFSINKSYLASNLINYGEKF